MAEPAVKRFFGPPPVQAPTKRLAEPPPRPEPEQREEAAPRALPTWLPMACLIGLVCLLLYGYGNTLEQTMLKWDSPKYSHGYLVPAFALVLLWLRRSPEAEKLDLVNWIGSGVAAGGMGLLLLAGFAVEMPVSWMRAAQLLGVMLCVAGSLLFIGEPIQFAGSDRRARLWGLGLLGFGLLSRLAFTWIMRMVPEMYSFIPSLIGVFMLVGGMKTFRWSWPALAFLAFMFPLPAPLEAGMLPYMQRVASVSSEYSLQTLGVSCQRDGNDMWVNGQKMEVEERCSGLRMLTIFMALSTAFAMVVDRPLWERIVLVLSGIPIALAANVIRITVTGLCYVLAQKGLYGMTAQRTNMLFHDGAGLVMMPLALGMLYVVYQILSHVMIDDGPSGPTSIGIRVPPAAR